MDILRNAVQGVFWLGGQYLADGFRRSVDTVCNVLHQVLEITGVKRPRVGVGDNEEKERKKIKLGTEAPKECISIDNNEEPFKILHYVGHKSNAAKRLRLEKVRKRMRQRLYRNHSNNVKNIHDRINAFLQSKYKADLVLSSNNCDAHVKEEPCLHGGSFVESHNSEQNECEVEPSVEVSYSNEDFQSNSQAINEGSIEAGQSKALTLSDNNAELSNVKEEPSSSFQRIIESRDSEQYKFHDERPIEVYITVSEGVQSNTQVIDERSIEPDQSNTLTINHANLSSVKKESSLSSHLEQFKCDYEPPGDVNISYEDLSEDELSISHIIKEEEENSSTQFIEEDHSSSKKEVGEIIDNERTVKCEHDDSNFVVINDVKVPNVTIKHEDELENIDHFHDVKEENEIQSKSQSDNFFRYRDSKETDNLHKKENPFSSDEIKTKDKNDSVSLKELEIIMKSAMEKSFASIVSKFSQIDSKLRDPQIIRKAKFTLPQTNCQSLYTPSTSKIIKEAKFKASQNINQDEPKNFVSINGVKFPNFEIKAEDKLESSRNIIEAANKNKFPLIVKDFSFYNQLRLFAQEKKFAAHQNVDQGEQEKVSLNRVPFTSPETLKNTSEATKEEESIAKFLNNLNNSLEATPKKEDTPTIKEASLDKNLGLIVQYGYVQVYTDGSCQNPGKPWATAGIGVWWGHGHKMNVSRRVRGWKQTNNVAEIQAVCKALEQAIDAKIDRLQINTDSQNVVKAATYWMTRRGWCYNSRDRIDFSVLDRLITEAEEKNMVIRWTKVKSHSNMRGNDMADRLAFLGSKMHYDK